MTEVAQFNQSTARGPTFSIEFTKGLCGINEYLLELFRRNASQVKALPVHILKITRTIRLVKVIDSPGEFRGALTSECRGVGDTLDHRNQFLNVTTGRGQLTKRLRHISEAITGFIRIPHEFLKVCINLIDTLTGGVHDSLNGSSLLFIFRPAISYLIDCQR